MRIKGSFESNVKLTSATGGRIRPRPLFGTVAGIAGAYGLIVLFAPLDVLDRYPTLGRFCDAVQQLILLVFPSTDIYRHAAATDFPQVAKLASGLAWPFALLVAAPFLVRTVVDFSVVRLSLMNGESLKDRLSAVVLLPALAILFWWLHFCVAGPSTGRFSSSAHSIAIFALLSTFILLLLGVVIGVWPGYVAAWRAEGREALRSR